jgi:predicted aminopeptidase
MTWKRLPYILILASMLVTLTHLAGCVGPSYYAQAISGHIELMRSRVPIAELISDPATDPDLVRRLQQTELMRQYAYQQLGLARNENYSRYAATERDAVTWNVVATAEFSIEPRLWCFPVAGCVAYRGYFNQDKAAAFAAKMSKKSLDVMISPAVAYSTLGWFEDPLLDTMLQHSDASLAGIIFHELAHERLYVKSDTSFNEAFASFVEETGVRLWLSDIGQASELLSWKERKSASQQFNGLLRVAQQKLVDIYNSDMPDESKRQNKKKVFNQLRADYDKMVESEWNGSSFFSNWMARDLNNAHLALMSSYAGGVCAFAQLYQLADRNLEKFYLLADEKSELEMEQRKIWLDSPCPEFASPEFASDEEV